MEGLSQVRETFAEYSENYVVIGGQPVTSP